MSRQQTIVVAFALVMTLILAVGVTGSVSGSEADVNETVIGESDVSFTPANEDAEDKNETIRDDPYIIEGENNSIDDKEWEWLVEPRETDTSEETTVVTTEISAEGIIDNEDERYELTGVDSGPELRTVRVSTQFGVDEPSGHCSGSMISEYHVLTAGHCAYNEDWEEITDDGWHPHVDDFVVEPGLYYSDEIDGHARPKHFARVEEVHLHPDWEDEYDAHHDIAVMTLDRPIGEETGYWSYFVGSTFGGDSEYEETTYVTGYPGQIFQDGDWDEPNHLMEDWGSGLDPYSGFYNYMDRYEVDTSGGQSGGPAWAFLDGNPTILSVHAYDQAWEGYNLGVRIGSGKNDYIQDWQNEEPFPEYRADLFDGSQFDYWESEPTLSDTSIVQGDEVTLTHDVHNVGMTTAYSPDVAYYLSEDFGVGWDPDEAIKIGDTSASSIAPFDRDEVTWSGAIDVPPGEYNVIRIVDYEDNIDEYDEAHNYPQHYENKLEVLEPAEFDVEITSTDVSYGLVVTDYEATNVGDAADEKEVVVKYDGEVECRDTFDLDGGESVDDWCVYEIESDDAPTIDIDVVSPDDEAETTVDVDPADFAVSISNVDDPVVETEDLDIDIWVNNHGDEPDEQVLSLFNDDTGTTCDSTLVSLKGEADETVELTCSTEEGDAPGFEVRAASDDDTDATFVDVDEAAHYAIEITSTTASDGEIDVTYEVANEGDVSGEQDVVFEVDGDYVTTHRDVVVSGGDDVTDTFTYALEVGDESPVSVAVNTDDEDDSETVAVDEPEFAIDITDTGVADGEIDVTYAVENDGDVPGEQNVVFEVDGDHEAVHEGVEVDADGEVTDTFAYELEAGDESPVPVEIATDDGYDAATVAVDEPELAVEITATSVTNGELTVDYVVENHGDVPDEQDVALAIDGTETETAATPELAAGETHDGDFVYEIQEGDAPGFDVEVSTDDDMDTVPVEVNPADVLVMIESTNAPVTAGDVLEVTAGVENAGDEPADDVIKLQDFAGATVDERSVELGGEDERTVTLEWSTDEDDATTDAISVQSDDDAGQVEVTVEEPPEYVVDAVETNAPVEEGETLTIEADVSNDGEVAGEENVTLIVDGEPADVEPDLALEPDESASVSLAYETAHGDAPSVDVTVETPHDANETTASVEEMPYVAVEIAETNAPVFEGETLNATVAVENTGDGETTQNISLYVDAASDEVPIDDGPVDVAEDVTLAGGESETLTLAYQPDDGDVPDVQLTAASEDEADTAIATVDAPAEFELQDVAIPDEVAAGFDLVVETDVENRGTVADVQNVTLVVDGDERDASEVSLAGQANSSVELAAAIDDDRAGAELAVELVTEDDAVEKSVSVVEPAPPFVEIETVETGDTVPAGADIEATAVLLNAGDLPANQTVGLAVDALGENATDEIDVELDRHETTTVDLGIPTEPDDAGQTVTATVSSDNDTVEQTIEIDEPIPPTFEFDRLEHTETVEAGDVLEATVAVTNNGTLTGSQNISLVLGADVVANESLTLAPDETAERNLTYETSDDYVGDHQLVVETANATVTAPVTVEEEASAPALPPMPPAPSEPNLVVSNASLESDDVQVGSSVDVRVELTNAGDAAGATELAIDLGPRTVTVESPTVRAGDSTTVTEEVVLNESGTHEVTVNETVAGTIAVSEESDSSDPNGTDDADDTEESDSDDTVVDDDPSAADDDGIPGFGAIAALAALLAAGLFRHRSR